MKNYIADESLIIFDVVPRKQYRGADVPGTIAREKSVLDPTAIGVANLVQ